MTIPGWAHIMQLDICHIPHHSRSARLYYDKYTTIDPRTSQHVFPSRLSSRLIL